MSALSMAGMTRDDAEQAISRIMGEYGFSMPSRAYAELVDELMSTPAAPGIDLTPRPMDTAPHDGTILRLLVQFTDNATEDTKGPAWTIGHNSRDNTGEDEWQFAGWCWTHDHYTSGEGTPVGWLPMDATPVAAAPAWVVTNGQGDKWRKWGDFGPEWTDDRNAALHFARRSDAEAFSAEDEDAWMIQPVGTPAALGIDLQSFRKVAMPILCPMLCARDAESVARKLHAAMIDAIPKSGEAQQAGAQAMVIAHTDGYRWNGQHWQKDSPKGGSDERARFEAWAEKHHRLSYPGYLARHALSGAYCIQVTDTAWDAWQAALQATSAEVGS